MLLAAGLACLLASSCGEGPPWLAPLNPAFLEHKAKTPSEDPLLTAEPPYYALGYIPSPIPPEKHRLRLRVAAAPTDPAYDMRDPNDDGDPSDAVFLAKVDTTVQNVDTSIVTEVALAAPVAVREAVVPPQPPEAPVWSKQRPDWANSAPAPSAAAAPAPASPGPGASTRTPPADRSTSR